MNLLYIIYTYNRPNILRQSLLSLFGNTEIHPDRVVVIDDGSEPQTKCNLFKFALENSANNPSMPIDFVSFNRNLGYGWVAELGIFMLNYFNPKYAMVVESDYIFRKGWCEEALAVLDAKPESVGLSGYSNPDFFQADKTEQMFPRIMKEDFGVDLAHRQFLHKPFKLDTRLGPIEVQGTTNSCGTFMLNWHRIQKLVKRFPEMKRTVFDRCCNKQAGGNRKYYADGPMTHGLSHYWYLDHAKSSIKPNQMTFDFDSNFFANEFPWLDICDYSIAQHVNGGGDLNGKIVPECTTFVGSPKWQNEYLEKNPRI